MFDGLKYILLFKHFQYNKCKKYKIVGKLFSFEKEKGGVVMKNEKYKMNLQMYFARTGKTYKEFGEMIGASASQISNYMSGRFFPPFQTICKMLEIGVKPKEIFGDLIKGTSEPKEFLKSPLGGATTIDDFFKNWPDCNSFLSVNENLNWIEFRLYENKFFPPIKKK